MIALTPELIGRFTAAVRDLDTRIPNADARLDDHNTVRELRAWLDGRDAPLEWATPYPEVTPDEWFFITTLYGEMKLDGQRTHIRKFFPVLFVRAAQRDIRNFCVDLPGYNGLRSAWMKARLSKMGSLLRERRMTMADYVQHLKCLEAQATPDDPTPALDTIVRDHQATGWKTLSVFVRDCVGGNCFPIDSRVEKELKLHGLRADEKLLVRLSLAVGRNPRQVARMFYEAGGKLGNVSVAHFVDDDDAYFAWLDGHPEGFVVNCYRTPTPSYLALHRAPCYHIQRSDRHTMTCGQYSKVCAETEQVLRDWAVGIGGAPTWCRDCQR